MNDDDENYVDLDENGEGLCFYEKSKEIQTLLPIFYRACSFLFSLFFFK